MPGPDSDGEGAGAAAQYGIGAVVGPLQGRDDIIVVHPDEGGAEEVPSTVPTAVLIVCPETKECTFTHNFSYFHWLVRGGGVG